ncbi:PREDICTED: two-component response regulator-like APRR5 isoform X2 [Tarenaya hassleriana]|uniref:two-component response regulator-like APRR5 isoform X2 n=1 Tax=Tarenaya hassleriana TaxID=28532 RepID=UPI00053C10D5|nr:PREDICTED: two-component response regulator-like APRR5 isoform X2 [Tarenaya hassleriana]
MEISWFFAVSGFALRVHDLCSVYEHEKVAAFPDGLKAWEMLKGRPESVDLILTEVDLPSISGYALLTLIMEHDICKNIPVIMMSKQDSVSTVYKCMLRGAADYLVKPLRRNELRNLWQHVWRRRHSFAAGDMPLDESVGQKKLEGTSDNNSTSNHRNAIEKDEQPVIGKGSDAQSSCTRPELEGESVDVANNQRDLLQMKSGKPLFNDMQVPENETESIHGVENVRGVDRDSCKEAIDFMGALFRRNEECIREEITAKYESRLELDLSLKRSNTSENPSSTDRPGLWPSIASAFTPYVHKPLQTQYSISREVSDQRLCVVENQNDKNSSEVTTFNHSNSSEPPPSALRRANAPGPPPNIQTSPWSHQSSYPVPIPVKGIRFSGQNLGYTSEMAPVIIAQSSPSPTPSPSSISPQEYSSRLHPCPHSSLENGTPECSQERDGYINHSTSPKGAGYKPDSVEERRYVSSVTEQSVLGRLCNADHHLEKKNEDEFPSPNGKSQRSLQREAALSKFRMKRKDRCFEKKVRYESRKKLAEQRPRVKGQFVRQAQVSEHSASTTQAPNAAAQDNPS